MAEKATTETVEQEARRTKADLLGAAERLRDALTAFADTGTDEEAVDMAGGITKRAEEFNAARTAWEAANSHGDKADPDAYVTEATAKIADMKQGDPRSAWGAIVDNAEFPYRLLSLAYAFRRQFLFDADTECIEKAASMQPGGVTESATQLFRRGHAIADRDMAQHWAFRMDKLVKALGGEGSGVGDSAVLCADPFI